MVDISRLRQVKIYLATGEDQWGNRWARVPVPGVNPPCDACRSRRSDWQLQQGETTYAVCERHQTNMRSTHIARSRTTPAAEKPSPGLEDGVPLPLDPAKAAETLQRHFTPAEIEEIVRRLRGESRCGAETQLSTIVVIC